MSRFGRSYGAYRLTGPPRVLGRIYPVEVSGTITPVGVATKRVNKPLSGSISSSGTIIKQVNKQVSGSITPGGTLIKQINKRLVGSITPSGSVAKIINKYFQGTITPTGALTTIGGASNLFGSMLVEILDYSIGFSLIVDQVQIALESIGVNLGIESNDIHLDIN